MGGGWWQAVTRVLSQQRPASRGQLATNSVKKVDKAALNAKSNLEFQIILPPQQI